MTEYKKGFSSDTTIKYNFLSFEKFTKNLFVCYPSSVCNLFHFFFTSLQTSCIVNEVDSISIDGPLPYPRKDSSKAP